MDSQYGFTSVEERLCIKASYARIPLTVAFELTPLCNMNCEMCYIRLGREEQEREHRLRTVEEWLGLAARLKEAGTLFILLTGGEPMLYPGFSKLYQELQKMGFILTINTNGTMCTEEIADILAAELPRRVNVTLYGASNETYARVTGNPRGYDQAMRGLNLLKERNIPVKLNCSMIRENMADTPKILDISEKLEFPLEYNTYMFPCSRHPRQAFPEAVRVTPEEAAKWEVYIKKRQKKETYNQVREKVLRDYRLADEEEPMDEAMRCRAGKSSCWIDWKGRMTPCVFLEEPAVDVFSHTVEEAWSVIGQGCDSTCLPRECTNCRHRSNCNICAAAARWESGSTQKKPEYLCKYMDKVVEILQAEESDGRE
ncbi:MAG: radical SAM protein [Lachnospiraceae bacterium]|nr:radical SAM protein [Lachnospiraceae bacterium]